eukprot:scaffold158109_cov50-Prasinocladus_malaysianus.AAC.1
MSAHVNMQPKSDDELGSHVYPLLVELTSIPCIAKFKVSTPILVLLRSGYLATSESMPFQWNCHLLHQRPSSGEMGFKEFRDVFQ